MSVSMVMATALILDRERHPVIDAPREVDHRANVGKFVGAHLVRKQLRLRADTAKLGAAWQQPEETVSLSDACGS
jgi:hypothetical protein